MVCFQTKNLNLGKFWRTLEWKMLKYFMAIWNILWTLGIFYDHLVHFMLNCYIFSRFWYHVPRKIWQPWSTTDDLAQESVSRLKGALALFQKIWPIFFSKKLESEIGGRSSRIAVFLDQPTQFKSRSCHLRCGNGALKARGMCTRRLFSSWKVRCHPPPKCGTHRSAIRLLAIDNISAATFIQLHLDNTDIVHNRLQFDLPASKSRS
jgi:hypothetical protein